MPAISTDILALKRGTTHYRTTAQEIANLAPTVSVIDTLLSNSATAALSANQGRILKNLIDGIGDITPVATIAARNALVGLDPGDLIHVLDDGDTKWARYQVISTTDGTWGNSVTVKVGDQDWTGIGAVNLGYTAAPAQGTITNSSGTTAVIPLADLTNAGLLAPAEKAKLGFISVTGATDLDLLRAASHAAATLAGTAATNPLTLAGQAFGFDIGQLAAAP
jgi:hypothetical protein